MGATRRMVFAGLVLAVTSAAAATGSSEEQRIRALDAEWSRAAAAKDVAKTVSFYADTAQVLPYNGPLVNGRNKIHDLWAGLMKNPAFAIHFEPTRIVVAKSKDVAFDVGTFELTLSDDRGQPSTVAGKFLVAWRKQKDGHWKVEADCFNTDK
jgi:uncharacterized protein (TIGR02246 family)